MPARGAACNLGLGFMVGVFGGGWYRVYEEKDDTCQQGNGGAGRGC